MVNSPIAWPMAGGGTSAKPAIWTVRTAVPSTRPTQNISARTAQAFSATPGTARVAKTAVARTSAGAASSRGPSRGSRRSTAWEASIRPTASGKTDSPASRAEAPRAAW